ncbi:hypothetical protein C7271_14525, partial [filamentous cyanobacterium CCP5]
MNSIYRLRTLFLLVGILGVLAGTWLGWLEPTVAADRYQPSLHSSGKPIFEMVAPSSQPIRVTTPADGGSGSLRWAIAQANQSPNPDLIDLSPGDSPIVLQSPLPPITSDLILSGNGTTISGNGRYRVLQIDGGDVALHDLTLANGLAQGPAGIEGGGGSAGMG